MTSVSDTPIRDDSRPRYGTLSLIVAGVFGLLYAYDLWEAVSNLIQLPVAYEQIGFDPAVIPWWLLIVGVLVPPVMFIAAAVIGRRQSVFAKALIFLVGLSVVAGLSLGAIALESVLRPTWTIAFSPE